MNTKSPKSQKKKSRYLERIRPRAQKEASKESFAGKEGNVIVAVMGTTGVGKSTFVKSLIEGPLAQTVVVKVGHVLESCTVELQPIPIPFKALSSSLKVGKSRESFERLVIVDTPGFDDTYEKDSVILRRIAEWLAISYSKNMKLGGVIYLHDISQPRMLDTYRKNLEMFSALCGRVALESVLLVTTKWGEVPPGVGEKREFQLQEIFWGDMLKSGAEIHRFHNISGSAWKIVESLLTRTIVKFRLLKIQEELVEMEKIIPATDAGSNCAIPLRRFSR